MLITLPSGKKIPANDQDRKDFLVRAFDIGKRYLPTTRQLGEIMMINRAKRKDMFRRARQVAVAVRTQRLSLRR